MTGIRKATIVSNYQAEMEQARKCINVANAYLEDGSISTAARGYRAAAIKLEEADRIRNEFFNEAAVQREQSNGEEKLSDEDEERLAKRSEYNTPHHGITIKDRGFTVASFNAAVNKAMKKRNGREPPGSVKTMISKVKQFKQKAWCSDGEMAALERFFK